MYRLASEFRQRHPEWFEHPGQEGARLAPWAVVAFHRQRGRTEEVRPYRRIWPFRDRRKAEAFARALLGRLEAGVVETVAFVGRGQPEWIDGSVEIVEQWVALRRGVNCGADPWRAARYTRRERSECRGQTYEEEGRRW